MKTLRLKLKPGKEGWLNACARETNLIWNFCNETTAKAARPYSGPGKWLSAYDVQKLLAGTSALLQRLPGLSVQKVAEEHAIRRKQFKRTRLAWRTSGGQRRALGWIPFRDGQVKFKRGAIVFAGQRFRVFDSYGLADFEFRSGSFAQDALGDWYFNVSVKTPETPTDLPPKAVGIDLGLKAIATTSDGEEMPAGRWTQAIAPKLAMAQRRGHKRQAKRIHRAAANRRKDALHKFSTGIVRKYGAIYIGDVSSTKLVKTCMAKSVFDSGWGMLKTMLQFKGDRAGCIVEVVNESFTTQACADCGSLTGPKGRTGLVVREWTCSACGTEHRRDVNAARNILARGLSRPSAGTTDQARKRAVAIQGETP